MAQTNESIAKLIKSFRAFLSRLEKSFSPNMFGGRGGGTNVSIDLNNTDAILERLEALFTTIDADTGALVIDVAALEVNSDAVVVDLAAIEVILTEIEVEAQQIRVNVDNTGGKSIADWLSDVEASLNTLIAANAADFTLNIAEIALQGAAIIVSVVANAVSIVASVAIGNARLADIKTAVEAIDVNTDGIEGGLQDMEDLLVTIDQDTNSIRVSADEIEAAIEVIESNAGTWQGMSIGAAITAGHMVLTTPSGNGTAVVASVDNVQYTEPAGTPVAILVRIDASKSIILDNSTWEMSANSAPATLTGNINNVNLVIPSFVFHAASSGTSNLSPLNGSANSFHLSQRDRLNLSSTVNPLAVGEIINWAASVKVWVPAI